MTPWKWRKAKGTHSSAQYHLWVGRIPLCGGAAKSNQGPRPNGIMRQPGKACLWCVKRRASFEQPAGEPRLSWRDRAKREASRRQMQALNAHQWTPERRRQMSIVIQRVRAGVAA